MKTNLKKCRFCSRIFALLAIITTLAFISQSAPTSGSYTTDVTQYFVQNPTQQSLSQVNEILCTIKKTEFEKMINQGQYVALVDTNTCSTSSSNTSTSNSVSSTPNMMHFIVNATQTNDNSPVQVQMWAIMPPQNGQTEPIMIKGTLTLTSARTSLNPYGEFTMDFAGFPMVNGTPSNTAAMKGYIISSTNSNGTGKLTFYEQDAEDSSNVLTLISNGSNDGYAKVQSNSHTDSKQTINYTVAFNNSLSLISTTSGKQMCYDRDDFNNLVYSYGLYDNSGNRVNLNSGFPVIYKGMQTWMSYFGLGVPPGVTLTDGDPITIINNDNTHTTGTLFVRQGKMQIMNAKALTLEQLSGTQFNVPNGNMSSDVLTWNPSTQNFTKIGTQTCNSNGCNQINSEPQTVTQTQLQNYANTFMNGGTNVNFQNPNINLWINGLGSGGNTQLSIGITANGGAFTFIAPTNSTTLKVWMSSPVSPSNTSAFKLYCMSQCPMDVNGTIISNPEFDTTGNYDNGHLMEYTFDPINYILYIESPNLIPMIPTNANANIFTGALITDAQRITLAGASFDGHAHSYEIFNGNGLNSYYNYNASGGNQPWNQFVSITTNGQLVSFDPPLQLVYTNQNGGDIFLQYFGFGNLQGIPGSCVDSNGNNVDCSTGGNGQFTIWVPSYSIPDGSQLIDASDGVTTYWIRQLNVAQQMAIAPDCSTLSSLLGDAAQLPLDTSGISWINPNGIGDMPNTTDAPRFINGVQQ